MSVWFDPHNITHCKAYQHLQTTGQWPEGFELHDVDEGATWQVIIMAKCTKAWIEHVLDKDWGYKSNASQAEATIEKLRTALVGLVGAKTKEELEGMKIALRLFPDGNQRTVSLNAINVLLEMVEVADKSSAGERIKQ